MHNYVSLISVLRQCFDEGAVEDSNAQYTYGDDGSYTVTARVDICYNQTYRSLCDYGWDDIDAEVFCRNRFGNDFGE